MRQLFKLKFVNPLVMSLRLQLLHCTGEGLPDVPAMMHRPDGSEQLHCPRVGAKFGNARDSSGELQVQEMAKVNKNTLYMFAKHNVMPVNTGACKTECQSYQPTVT